MTASRTAHAAELPVVEVTLLEDRAQVVRRGRVTVAAGGSRLVVEGVAPVLSDKTLVAQVVGAAAGSARVIDARVRRRIVRPPLEIEEQPGDDAIGGAVDKDQLVARRAGLAAEIEARRDTLQVLSRRAKGLDEVASHSVGELAVDVAWARSPSEGWDARLDQIEAAEQAVATELGDLVREISKRSAALDRLDGRIAALDHRSEHEAASVELELHASEAGEVEVELDYVVPGACWRPYHTARLHDTGDGPAVTLATDACVWQNTGEDWREVALLLSTERASLGVEPPELDSDVLGWRRKSDAIVVETRDQEIDTVGHGAAARPARPELPGIDDGGAAIHLRAPSPATVIGDGKPYRVRLSEHTAAATRELVAFPELSSNVVLATTQANPGTTPILAGPVDLIRDSGLVGRTKVLFIAPNEKYQLGWGPEADLRIKRTVDEHREKSRRLSSWVDQRHQIKVRLSNLGQAKRLVVVTERIPVSEIDKVKIELDSKATTGGKQPDEHGFLRWAVELGGFGHETIRLDYTLRKHEDVVGL